MLRCLVVLLTLVLLLCGCAQDATEPPAPTEIDKETNASASIYIQGSSVEKATGGAIRAFRLDSGIYYDCVLFADGLILMHSSGAEGIFTLYKGENLEKAQDVILGENVMPETSHLQCSEQGIGYYDPTNKAVVFLNSDLAETRRISLPEMPQGNVWLSPDWQTVYYCTEQGIYATDLQTGLPRLLRLQSVAFQEITGIFGNGEILRCNVELENGVRETRLIEAATGLQVYAGDRFETLQTHGTQYFFRDAERGVERIRFGSQEEHQVLWPNEQDAKYEVLLADNAIVLVQETQEHTQLTWYDLLTGQRKAAVTLEGITEVKNLRGDGKGGVWMFAGNAAGDRWLYHWNTEKSLTEDTQDYTTPLYTMEAPDVDGLAQLAERAGELGDKFNVDILLWEDAAALAPENYLFTEEYLTQLYQRYLPRVEQVLSAFPKEIFTKSSEKRLQIGLVQEITGDPALGTLPVRQSMQFWNGENPVVVVTMGENFERELLRSVYLYMETRLLSKSNALYEWYRINPTDFNYDEDYISNLGRADTTYTEGDTAYFIDLFSMSFAREDRATIFAHACLQEGEDRFSAPVLQEKLKRICKGIRAAYGLKKVETEFLWEQYLL